MTVSVVDAVVVAAAYEDGVIGAMGDDSQLLFLQQSRFNSTTHAHRKCRAELLVLTRRREIVRRSILVQQ